MQSQMARSMLPTAVASCASEASAAGGRYADDNTGRCGTSDAFMHGQSRHRHDDIGQDAAANLREAGNGTNHYT
jgi:hypothetical protein